MKPTHHFGHRSSEENSLIALIVQTTIKAIHNTPVLHRPTGLHDFPVAGCYDSALILLEVFKENGISGYKGVSGDSTHLFKEGTRVARHVWITNDKQIIDITIQTFKPEEEGCIFKTPSDFHSLFTSIEEILPFDYDSTETCARLELIEMINNKLKNPNINTQ